MAVRGLGLLLCFLQSSSHGEDEETMPWRHPASLLAPGVCCPWSSACRCQGRSRYAIFARPRAKNLGLYLVCLPCIVSLLFLYTALAFNDSVQLGEKNLNWNTRKLV